MLNKLRHILARLSGYDKTLRTAVDLIVSLNSQVCKYQGEAYKLQKQLTEQREELRGVIADLELRAKRGAEWYEEALETGLYELVLAADYGSKRDFLRPLTQRTASQSIDTADCQPCGPIFYLKDGKLIDVSLGQQTRAEPDERGEIPFEYAESAILADGEVVGYVTHTDH